MMDEKIKVTNHAGFNRLKSPPGVSLISFIAKPGISNEYSVGELTKVTGICSYQFLSSAGVIRGILITSPKAHTISTPIFIKIGLCQGPFSINNNLQQVGILMYESADSSVLIIPVEVKSPLLVEVNA